MKKNFRILIVFLVMLMIPSFGFSEPLRGTTLYKDVSKENIFYDDINKMILLEIMSGNFSFRLWHPAKKSDLEKLLGADYKIDDDISLSNLANKIVENIEELTYNNYEYYRSELEGISNRNILKCYSEGIFNKELLEKYGVSDKKISLKDLIKIRENMLKPLYPDRPEYTMRDKIPILMYHEINILPKDGATGLYVHPDTFKAHLDALKENGYNAVTMKQLYNHWEEGLPLPKNPIVISFDDGYDSHYTFASDELSKRGMTGTMYIITDRIGTNDIRTEENLKKIYLDGVEIGSHTVSHIDSSKEDKDILRFEYEDSKSRLEEILGEEVACLAYPYGKYTKYVLELLDELGYKAAVTTQYGIANMNQGHLTLKRIVVDYNDSPEDLLKKIDGK